MKTVEFATRLKELKAASPAFARMTAHALAPHAHRVDAVLRQEFLNTMDRLGLSRPEIASVGLAHGEAWVLLYEPPDRGWAVRLRVRYGVSLKAGDDVLTKEIRRAHRGLLSAAGRECRQLGRSDPPSLDFDVGLGTFDIEGGSLGLSLAIATLSDALERPSLAHVVGSAVVSEDGQLLPVRHLAQKLDSVRRSWPEVTMVVVATGQTLPDGYVSPIQLVHCGSLADAIPLFGLTLDNLPAAPLEVFRDRLARFETDNAHPHPATDWVRLSNIALEVSCALATDEPGDSARAMVWSALFAVHSGDPDAASALLRRVSPDATAAYPELRALQLVIRATTAIDEEDLEGAITTAAESVELSESLGPRDRRVLLGQALGTHGRSLMHAGRFDEAERAFHLAVEHYLHEVPREAPRTQGYLATCLRLHGKPEEALGVVEAALVGATAAAKSWLMGSTILFLRLERGRINAALANWSVAIEDLQAVRDGQVDDTAYPRLGALRSLAAALSHVGQHDAGDNALGACLAVVRRPCAPVLRKVAAMAACEALINNRATRFAHGELEAAWTVAFAVAVDRDAMELRIRTWVY